MLFWVAHFVSFFVALFQGHYSIGLQQLLQAEEAEAGQLLRENGTIFFQRDTGFKKLGFVGVIGSMGLVFIYLYTWRFILQEISSGVRFPVVSVISGVSCHFMSFQWF